MRKLNLSLFLLLCILASSIMPSYADNNLVFGKNTSELTFNEDNSLNGPKRRPVRRGGRRGKKGSEFAIQKNNLVIDAGVSYPIWALLPSADMTLPPISLGVDYCFFSTGRIALSAGILGSYGMMDATKDMGFVNPFDTAAVLDSKKPAKLSPYYAGGKFTFTLNFSKYVAMYAYLSIGYFDFNLTEGKPEEVSVPVIASVNGAGMMGFKFFFTKNIGSFIEFGYDMNRLASAGLSIKF
ncbi:MAG: hypothetical protein H6Q16_1672 [Bacteroidetes bacterium]|nr:hypothetical protein [Bacteroidota bacterium]